ncbi:MULTISPECIES: hypothetical protein [unclassified Rhodococcus (in: high G+C Gram-positive bacteria)]|uniref:hypothetical protein n=1 Tax=unclassified Rhodococcus (in: high G+C Gram-positive bacteria) TaxID=192944 RepID=UPI001179A4C1|nr:MULTISPECIES: hypothetical protein [unclassified Rhodococcus (in: high G+C Gram-positive bacteria)]
MDGAEAGLGRLRVRSEEVDAAGAGAGRKAVENAVERRLRPLEVHVSGRVGVGKSVIVSVLDAARLHTDGFEVRLHESGWADIPRAAEVQQSRTASDIDVLVHVLAGAVSPDDITFLSARPGGPPAHTVILLNKADTLDEPAATAAAASEQLGRRVLPVMGSVAAGLGGADRGSAVDMADVRAVAAGALRTGDLMTVDRLGVLIFRSRRRAERHCWTGWNYAVSPYSSMRSGGVAKCPTRMYCVSCGRPPGSTP